MSKYLISLFCKYFNVLKPELKPEKAYDIWSKNYDNQTDNLLIELDNELLKLLLNGVTVQGKKIVDIGCGTGRHWSLISSKAPDLLIGCDVSNGMLSMLKDKFPDAITCKIRSNQIDLPDSKFHIVISTLAIAHIKDIESAFKEWMRVLVKESGDIIITDYHPDLIEMGGDITFKHGKKRIAIKKFHHSIEKLKNIFERYDFKIIQYKERLVDSQVKHYYENQNAMHIYRKFEGTALIYGIHIRRQPET